VIDDKLKQVTTVVQGSHVTHGPLVCLILSNFLFCFKTYFTRGLLAGR